MSVYLSNAASATKPAATIDAGEERPAQAPEHQPQPTQRSGLEPAEPSEFDRAPSPFDAEGWDSLRQQGNPWVLSLMASLNTMKVPAWAAKLPVDGPYSFKLKVCENGTVEKVYNAGSSGNADSDAAVKGELERLKFDVIPAEFVAQMDASCATLSHTFEWTKGRVR